MKSWPPKLGASRKLPLPFWVLGSLGILTLGEMGVVWSSKSHAPIARSQAIRDERPLAQSQAVPVVERATGDSGQPGGDIARQELSSGIPAQEETIEATAIKLANTDLKQATDWLGKIQDPESRLRATFAISNEAIRSNPKVALKLVVNLEETPQRDELIRRGVAEWALSDAAGAKEWAVQIEDERLRSGVIAGLATSWSDSSPVDAANLALDELPSGRLQSDTLVSIIQRWAQTNPKAAADWVQQFPEGDLKEVAAKNLVAVWSVRDAAEAGKWNGAKTRSQKAPAR